MESIIITGVGSELQGVGHLADGRAVFVPGALPGEKVRIGIIREAQRFCEARIEEIEEASPHRRPGDCPVYGRCGGCRTRHMEYGCALDMKRQRVADALERIGGVEGPPVAGTAACADPDHTRNKAEFRIECGRDGRAHIGLTGAGSHRFVPVAECRLLRPAIGRALAVFHERLPGWREASQWEGLVARTNRAGELMLIVTSHAPVAATVERRWPELVKALPELRSLWFLKLNRTAKHALDGAGTLLHGDPVLKDRLMGLDFEISPQSFFQVNPEQTEVLYGLALRAAGVDTPGDMRVLDVYCGAGTITLAAARNASAAVGVEVVPQAIENARRNAQRNGLTDRARFICGDAAREIPRLLAGGERFDSVILDPPRKGADRALIETLITARPERICYVSCEPSTLARDVKLLSEGGYRLQQAWPVDMFPGTAHVETVVLMSRVKD